MIAQEGLGTWALFGDAILAGGLLATLLPLLGVVLVLRHQVFLTASIGQAATLGIAFAWWLGAGDDHGEHDVVTLVAGASCAMATAIAAMRALSVRDAAIEARAAWVFLVAGAGSMLLLANSPHGTHGIQRLLLSSVLGASPTDVVIAAVALLVVVVGIVRRRRGLVAWAIDPQFAAVCGSNVASFDVAIGALLGALIGFSIHATGLVFTFGAALLPVLVARHVATSLAAVVLFAPLIGLLGFGTGFVVGDRVDLPPGQVTVVVLAALVPLAALAARGLRRSRSRRVP